MAVKRSDLWTLGKRLAGNVAPMMLACPFFFLAMIELARFGATMKVAGYGLAFLVVGWLGTNFMGLWGNQAMRRQMETRFRSMNPESAERRVFVGFARPSYRGLLDPHEDVGFLVFAEDGIQFKSDMNDIFMPAGLATQVYRKANIHSSLGLGGWICVEGELNGQLVQLLMEPREKKTLLGNKALSKVLIKEISAHVGLV